MKNPITLIFTLVLPLQRLALSAVLTLITCNCDGNPSSNLSGQSDNDKTLILVVKGMTCQDCKSIIENSLKQINGVASAEVTLPKTVRVVYDPNKIVLTDIKKAIEDAGYTVE
jgi:copper chaperone